MLETFETFKPKHPLISRYVDYYYLDIKPANKLTTYECFPHFNNTISFYKCHQRDDDCAIYYNENAEPYQIFTPVREKVLQVKQIGTVHRLVIVFKTLGIQRFYQRQNFADYITDFKFFTVQELDDLFGTIDVTMLTYFLDGFLLKRFKSGDYKVLDWAARHIFNTYDGFSVEKLAKELNMSRKHLNRLFKLHLGVSVKKFHEIVLLRKIIDKKLFINPQQSFTELAYELNFSDQSHLNKSFKNLTDSPPLQFFKKGTLLGKEDIFWHFVQ